MFQLLLCSEVIAKKRQKLAVKFSSGLDQQLTSTFSSLLIIGVHKFV